MGYEVKYHTNLYRDMKIQKVRKKSSAYLKWIFLAAVLTIGISIPGIEFWMDCLIPGDTSLTAAAMEAFAENIYEGIPLDAAFHEFCLEIVKGE